MFDAEGKGHHGRDGIGAFWDMTIGNVERFEFTIRDSHAGGDEVANVGTITTYLPGGYRVDTDGVFVYRVGEDGLIRSVRAFWETERAMATARQVTE
jgi:steroid delta-isomerase